jgi:rhamnosyl/mannosyltransferase
LIRVLTFGRFADDNFGGLERYVFELARGLQGEVEFTNIVAKRGGLPDVQVIGETVYARPWASLGGAPVCPTMAWHALARHRARRFDLIHLQFPADPMAHLSASLLPAAVPRVLSWHSDIVRQQGLLRYYRPFLDRLVRSADAIIGATPFHFSASTQLSAVRDPGRLHIVPYGFDLTRFDQRPALADQLRARYNGTIVFALGRHVYYKGFAFLIRALARLPAVQLLLGGQGPLTADLRRIAEEAGVAQRVHFVGRIPETDLPAYYHACDVFCMPSVETAEGFGIVQIEAMACARPVVCCELGNGVTWVNRHGETGLVVERGNPSTLAAAIDQLASDDALRRKLGEQGRRWAMATFTTEAMARGTLAVYKSVLDARAGAKLIHAL